MARKHSKRGTMKQHTVTVVLAREVLDENNREVTEVPEGTPGAHPITQEDGTTKFFLVKPKVLIPARTYQRAVGPTTTRGKQNDTKHMVKKGAKK